MSAVYAKLRALGLTRPYVREVLLPEWWDDAAAITDAGYTEVLWTLARHLGLSPQALRGDGGELKLPDAPRVLFKNTASVAPQDVALARTLAVQTAKFAALGAPQAQIERPNSALDTRDAILDTGAPWVGFGELLDLCWSLGIPVIHVSRLPRNSKKMQGLAANIDGRFAIVVSVARKHPAWMLFILAHELGHILLGHVSAESALVDAEVDPDSVDPQELSANKFAMELITGRSDTRVMPGGRWPNADRLATSAQALAVQSKIDPGHLILNYANSMSTKSNTFWPVASAALSKLPSQVSPVELINRRLAERLNWDGLPRETAEFVARMTRPPQDSAA